MSETKGASTVGFTHSLNPYSVMLLDVVIAMLEKCPFKNIKIFLGENGLILK